MNVNRLERVVYDLGVNRDAKQKFREDAARFLAGYNLTAEEQELITTFDVKKLAELGVSPLALMGYWIQVEPTRHMGTYMKRMQGET
ncbi:extradiol ring-cleavage dioxygenase [Kordiimonas pumila]|uniref:Extradiol ring-cleavage dioxygenase n=1 Tax=Kordiimonas pumila TaxID=2161677 RepID=A0ABV7D0I6_9PROT|nr:extradiol ring-cleavage dioxygenase [Kordiimonas pumila]